MKELLKRNSYFVDLIITLRKLKNLPNRNGNIVLFHIGRSGSAVLSEQIVQHPSIKWVGEFFENFEKKHFYNWSYRNPLKHLEFAKVGSYKPFFGFEFKGLPDQHIRKEWLNLSLENFFDHVEKNGYNYYILLKRENYLRRTISTVVGFKTGVWNSSAKSSMNKIHIDPKNLPIGYSTKPLLEHFKEIDDYYTKIRERFQGFYPFLELSYEDDIEKDPRKSYRKVCDFLGIEYSQNETRSKRRNPYPASEIIENFSEITEILKGTKYEWMLSDEF
jgi:hypothetical protein